MTRLSVNINKIATLRNSRGGDRPNVKRAAIKCQEFGAEGITIHPRPDERHITRQDVYDLKEVVHTEFNIEGYPSEDFIKMVCEVQPEQVTLVPDKPGQLTSDHGWSTWDHLSFLKETIQRFHEFDIRTSIFVDPSCKDIEGAYETKTDRVELYTESYAKSFKTNKEKAIEKFKEAAVCANELGVGLNAGHDLDLDNLRYFHQEILNLKEVSIGHALISDALYLGLEQTIKKYLNALK